MSHHHVDAKISPATTQSSQVGPKPANSKTTSVAAVQKRNPTLAVQKRNPTLGVQKRSATSVVAPRAGVVPPIAPQPPAGLELRFRMENDEAMSDGPVGGKREVKRAANRRSAQLSRKRKKVFIEELKEENDELRRKEQILKSLPDLVVVFDSSGKLGFVSHSVSRLLDFTAEELEGTSFWDRLCEDSVRLLKAAFMDSLATREAGSETAPLGAGVWELRLVDKNDSQKLVALNGVVHFAGDRPECVCSIRPRDKGDASSSGGNNKSGHPTVSIDERQSATKSMEGPLSAKKGGLVGSGKARELVRISDSGNSSGGSGESESGSSDE
jgi:PAS domain-containing protein